ncbi:hypothetical protein HWI79_2112 [Cryptosporidium felis]|nr:hypothetical protein HWI79_2112 [Cryptosporidium felis]
MKTTKIIIFSLYLVFLGTLGGCQVFRHRTLEDEYNTQIVEEVEASTQSLGLNDIYKSTSSSLLEDAYSRLKKVREKLANLVSGVGENMRNVVSGKERVES